MTVEAAGVSQELDMARTLVTVLETLEGLSRLEKARTMGAVCIMLGHYEIAATFATLAEVLDRKERGITDGR